MEPHICSIQCTFSFYKAPTLTKVLQKINLWRQDNIPLLTFTVKSVEIPNLSDGDTYFLFNFSYENLYYLKYPLTILFASIFFGLNFYSVKILSLTKSNHLYVIYTYAVMLLIAGLSMTYAYLFTKNLANDEYTLSRWLLGVAQSPLICLFLLASEKLMYKSSHHD